jgi:DNA-directed RNA polymerase specialized sigma24 family protein
MWTTVAPRRSNIWRILCIRRIWQKSGNSGIFAFCREIARNVYREFRKTRAGRLKREESLNLLEHWLAVGRNDAEDEVIDEEEAQEVRNYLDLFTLDYRRPLHLHYLEGKQPPEIARLLS